MFSAPTVRQQWMICVLIYNFCAFAVQMPLGLFVDRFGNGEAFASVGCLLLALSPLFVKIPVLLCIAAGLGNALFHVGAGGDILEMCPDKAGLFGVFVSPGAFGIFLGALAGKTASIPLWCASAVSVICAVFCYTVSSEKANGTRRKNQIKNDEKTDGKTGKKLLIKTAALACLTAVVALRSFQGLAMDFDWKKGAALGFAAVFATASGKAAGGFMKDRFGAVRTSAASLILSSILFCFSSSVIPALIAIFLFNITMPITLDRAASLLPRMKAFSFGLLTFALFLGFAAVYIGAGLPKSGVYYALVAFASLILLLPGIIFPRKKS